MGLRFCHMPSVHHSSRLRKLFTLLPILQGSCTRTDSSAGNSSASIIRGANTAQVESAAAMAGTAARYRTSMYALLFML
jgi:hypothetical protein